jgi:hypothetical protein
LPSETLSCLLISNITRCAGGALELDNFTAGDRPGRLRWIERAECLVTVLIETYFEVSGVSGKNIDTLLGKRDITVEGSKLLESIGRLGVLVNIPGPPKVRLCVRVSGVVVAVGVEGAFSGKVLSGVACVIIVCGTSITEWIASVILPC